MKKLLVAAVVVVAVGPVVAVVAAVSGRSGTVAAASTTSCTAGQTATVSDPSLDQVQAARAGVIIGTGQAAGVPTFGLEVAVAVAYQESKLRVLANSTVPDSMSVPHDGVGSDHDSVGLFQQRASWGSIAERMDPAASAVLFYRALSRVPGWQSMSLTVAAQTVQGSAYPSAYAPWQALAEKLVGGATGAATGTLVSACSDVVSSPVSGAAGKAINHALAAVGTLYSFGGSCADPHSADMHAHCDCSSLVQTAWAAAGVALPRTSEDQYKATLAHRVAGVTAANVARLAQPGWLLFYEWGEDGLPGPGHVALAIGGGKLVEAPQLGEDVHVIPIYSATFVSAATVG